jgi:hypothetical protein
VGDTAKSLPVNAGPATPDDSDASPVRARTSAHPAHGGGERDCLPDGAGQGPRTRLSGQGEEDDGMSVRSCG